MKKRYSKYIRPLMLLIDLTIINSVILYIPNREYLQPSFLIYINVFWVLSSFFTGFYKVYRYTNYYKIVAMLAAQCSLFVLGYFTYFTLFKEGEIINNQTVVLSTIIGAITVFKVLFLYALKTYRAAGKNARKVVVLGADSSAKKIIKIFKEERSLGYVFKGFFSDKKSKNNMYLGNLESCFLYIKNNEIDEIYGSLSELNSQQIKIITKFASEHNRVLKLIPNANELYNKTFSPEVYNESTLVLNVQRNPFEYPENHFIKRLFDVVFSLFVLVFLLSWLTPIIWIFIKTESKGSAFFKQKREGLNGKQFVCYKFRSMKVNKLSDQIHATKNDVRITKIGGFLRKTSLDELPQFFNVLKGNMSVVGPRPHLKKLSAEYQKEVNNYLERHAVKPGITGLAQVSGYRGEIKMKSDIKNRIRLDIFYIENWSFLLDIKIIFQTVFNVFKGEKNAY